MNGVDYAQKLNRHREIFQKNLRDANRNHAEEVENLKETNENVNAQRAKAYREDKQRIEKSYQ